MGTIKQLPVHLINKIAAGECIERPASVVKELVENALDAGASKIDVYIEQGGTKLIRVVDNGKGIAREDLPLAVRQHATSKLTDENDLYAINTMGFRGEALASIAAVAVLKISSMPEGQSEGASIEVRGGEVSPVVPYAASSGTVVEVHNLFFNTPARRKFLKTANTEMNHCQEAIIRLALPREDISFSFYHNNRKLIEVSAGESKRQRIADLFGIEIADTLVQVFTQKENITFTAYVCKPEFARPSNRWQYFFVNNRAIKDKVISHALKEAYRGLMPHDRQPIGFLFLDIDPSMVDVNVHPTKSEVRFADSGYIHSLVLGAIRQRFLSSDLTAALEITDSKGPTNTKADQGKEQTQHHQAVKEALTDFFKTANHSQQMKIDFRQAHKPTPAPMRSQSSEANIGEKPTTQGISEDKDTQPVRKQPKALQIHNSYLVVETENGLMIIDQHAQHERILYHQLKKRIEAGPIAKQKLLIPEVVNLTSRQIAQIEQIRDQLDKAGVETEPFGPHSIAINSLPAMFRNLNAAEFIEDLLARLENVPQVDAETVLEHILQSLACKSAVKAGDQLKPEEIEALLESRDSTDFTNSCPHGRPTALKMTLSELEKQFKRT